jgi:predicted permease
LGLSVGISACLAIWLIVRYEFSFDTFHSDKERIYRVVSDFVFSGEQYHNSGVSAPVPLAMREEFTGLEQVAPVHDLHMKVLLKDVQGNPQIFEKSKTASTDPHYFDIFRYEWVEGNPRMALSEPYKVVLTESEAHKFFGNLALKDIMGKTLDYANYSDTVSFTVTGIVKDWKENTDLDFKSFFSFSTLSQIDKWKKNYNIDRWDNTNGSSQAFIKLAAGTTPAQIRAQFPAFEKKHIKDEPNSKTSYNLQSLSDIHFNHTYMGNHRLAHLPTLYALMGVAGFLILIAAINFINLTTAQSLQRAKEIGVRKVMGSSKLHLILQFLSEAFLITTLAVILSLTLTPPILYFFKSFIPEGVVFKMSDTQNLLFLAVLTLATTLLSGIYPAWMISSFQPVEALKNHTSHKGTRKSRLREALIVFQFAVSLVFIIATLIVGNQIQYLLNKDMGFSKDAIIFFQTDWRSEESKKQVLMEKIRQIPEVKQLSLSQSTPAEAGYSTTSAEFTEGGKNISTNIHNKTGDAEFIKLYDIKLIAGRNIRNSDSLTEILVNESYTKMLGFSNPSQALNHSVKIGGDHLFPIVGVVADFNVMPLKESIKPLYIGCEPRYATTINIKLNTQNKELSGFKQAILKIESSWKEVYPNKKFEYHFFDETIANFYKNEQKTAQIMSAATSIAILISCMGLMGLVAYTIQQRTKEIGIRKVLGASVGQLVTLLSKEFLKLVLIAFVIAVPVAWYFTNKWLQDFAYRVNISWWIFAVAGVSALLVALLTVSFQAIKAALANPVKSLRTE